MGLDFELWSGIYREYYRIIKAGKNLSLREMRDYLTFAEARVYYTIEEMNCWNENFGLPFILTKGASSFGGHSVQELNVRTANIKKNIQDVYCKVLDGIILTNDYMLMENIRILQKQEIIADECVQDSMIAFFETDQKLQDGGATTIIPSKNLQKVMEKKEKVLALSKQYIQK